MFDDLNQKGRDGQPESTAPVVPTPAQGTGVAEDMFSGSDPEKPAAFQPKKPMSNFQDSPSPVPSDGSGHAIKKIIFLSLIVVGVGMIGFGGYYAYENFYKNQATDPEQQAIGQEQASPAGQSPEAVTGLTVVEDEVAEVPLDTDQDGLTDAEEDALGTNKTETDSDFDGLFDREEVRVYKTNPINPDTDGDGVKDGAEVDAKTNPNGEGSLYSLDGSSSTTQSIPPVPTAVSPDGVAQTASTGNPVLETLSGSEQASGTDNIKSAEDSLDSDGDGLTDAEETGKYGTDPMNKDTDGDGYEDGAEVKGGYNPKGAGKLQL